MPKAAHTRKRASAGGLKLLGALVLVLSAIVQNFVYDYSSDAANDLSRAIDERALIDKGGLINQADYYILSNSANPTSITKLQATIQLRQYALKLYQSQEVVVSAGEGVLDEGRAEYLESLHGRLAFVHDVQTLDDFIELINAAGKKYDDINDRLKYLEAWKSIARGAFLALYLIGAFFALRGGYVEWREKQAELRALKVR